MMIEIGENIYWDNNKGLYEQESEAMSIVQNIIDNIEPTIFVDEYNRPTSTVWINENLKISHNVVYVNEGNHRMSWMPLKDNFMVSKLK